VWLPTTFQIIIEPFSEENKMVNSTMKLVRHRIFDHYGDRIEYMYSDEGKHWYNPRNIEAVLELFPELSE
jgi:long-chain acyl-CoA synthetase